MTPIDIVRIAKEHDRTAFSCGQPSLDRWLKEQSGQQDRRDNARTFVAVAPPSQTVIGYYATTTCRLMPDDVTLAAPRRAYPVPGVLLAQLAVDRSWTGRGIGSRLLLDALQRMVRANDEVGFEVVVVHAIDDEARTFYARHGFIQFGDHPNHLWLPMKDVRATLAQP